MIYEDDEIFVEFKEDSFKKLLEEHLKTNTLDQAFQMVKDALIAEGYKK